MDTARSVAARTAAVAVALLLAACAAADDEAPVSPPDETATDGTEPTPPAAPGDEDPSADAGTDPDGAGTDLDAAVDEAVAHLAATAVTDTTQVEVRTAEPVTWSDGSLGCPEPGMMYTQALVPGYRIVLAVDGDEIAYHGAEGATPQRCDDPQPPSDPGT